MAIPVPVLRIALASEPLDTPSWTEIDEVVMAFETNRGANSETDQVQAGSAMVEVNNDDRALEPFYIPSAYYGATEPGQLVPSKQAQLLVDDVEIFRGMIEQIECVIGEGSNTATLTFVDLMRYLGKVEVDREVVFTNSPLPISTVVTNILNAVGVPASLQSVAETTFTAMAVMDPDIQVALTVLQSLALAEGGRFYISRTGVATFEGATTRTTQDRSNTVQATIGSFPVWILEDPVYGVLGSTTLPGPGGIPIAAPVSYYTRESDIINQVRISRSGGSDYTFDDTDSQAAYLTNVRSLTGLVLDNNTDVLARGNAELYRYSRPGARFGDVTINVNALGDIAAWVLGDETLGVLGVTTIPGPISGLSLNLDISSKVQLIIHQMQGGDDISEPQLVERIRHVYRGNVMYTILTLSPGYFYQYWILGSSDFSQLGQTTVVSH